MLEKLELKNLLARQAFLEAISGITPAPPAPSQPTPSAALVKAAAAQGVSLATLQSLTPAELAQLQKMFDEGDF